ncbi:tail fiber assembly protein [Acetobacter fallax]|uniref:Uncharacterized protein n=1 Tax=Acetobacter fallax TaxID=1737473 RepID=A0ABX0KE16_9PROT|nr:hypothetical protein [Acetobacter fallax]NHO33341.1 hypothetical protein [Acetobacter fallax]NHO36962.1 hypothetical protein [Acetobacter fallax]
MATDMKGRVFFWSASRSTFYPAELREIYKTSVHGWPSDAVEVDTALFVEYGLGSARPGKRRGTGPDGLPAWVTA